MDGLKMLIIFQVLGLQTEKFYVNEVSGCCKENDCSTWKTGHYHTILGMNQYLVNIIGTLPAEIMLAG